jgi:formylglycine-generating enzyme required for sulfatase activity
MEPKIASALLAALALPPFHSPAQQHAPRASVVDGATPATGKEVALELSWPNAWRNERNHDAAWLILRDGDPRRGPLRLAASGHSARGEVPGTVEVSSDRLGAFVYPAEAHRGAVSWHVTLRLEEPAPAAVTAWAVGMVFVPGGPFELGDDDELLLDYGAFHSTGADGEASGPFLVEGEGPIEVGKRSGALGYAGDKNGYRGDQLGPIPAAWPKGSEPFYVMKHELTQGAYAAFLNALPEDWQKLRAPLELRGEELESCSIARESGRFVARASDRPCNFVSWTDTSALFDWLALRPMSEFEFEKACRGPRRPMPRDYPWGSASTARLERRVLPSRDLEHPTVAAEATLSDAERERLGASFYWVMDLSGSLWERVVSAGHPKGRAFQGSHGDGVLSSAGQATNADWPSADPDGKNAPGIGYRGGAEYFSAPQPDDPTNPNSPTACRTFAGWGGAERYKTYSARAVRSVNP